MFHVVCLQTGGLYDSQNQVILDFYVETKEGSLCRFIVLSKRIQSRLNPLLRPELSGWQFCAFCQFFSLTDVQIDALNVLLGSKAKQVDMENNAMLISILDICLTDNVVLLRTTETNISILHSNIDIIYLNISILHANVVTLTEGVESNASRTSAVESNICNIYDVVDENNEALVLLGNVSPLHTIVESLEIHLTSNTVRIAAIEADYVTNSDLATSAVATGGSEALLTAALTLFNYFNSSTQTATSKTTYTSRYNGGWLEFSKACTAPSISPHSYHVTIYGDIN